MKIKFTVLEIIILIVILSVCLLLVSPRLVNSADSLKRASVRANVSIAVSAIQSIFALKEGSDVVKIADLMAETLNKTTKNPYNKKLGAYQVNSVSQGSVVLFVEEKNDFITVKGYADSVESPILTEVIHKIK